MTYTHNLQIYILIDTLRLVKAFLTQIVSQIIVNWRIVAHNKIKVKFHCEVKNVRPMTTITQ